MGSSVCCIQADIFCCCCLSSSFLTAAGFKAVELRGVWFFEMQTYYKRASISRIRGSHPFEKKSPSIPFSQICLPSNAGSNNRLPTNCIRVSKNKLPLLFYVRGKCCPYVFPGMRSRYVYLMIIKSPLSSGRRELRERKGENGSPTNGFSYIPPFSFSPCN